MKPLSLLIAAVSLVLMSSVVGAQPSNGASFVTPIGKTVYRSGNAYFINACDTPARLGDMQCYAKIVTDAKGNPFATKITTKGYTASDLRAAYGLGAVPAVSTFAGQPIVAVVIPYHHAKLAANLATYRQTMGLPACTTANGCLTVIYQSGSTAPPAPPAGSNWGVEASLDVQMVSASCPQCRISVFEANSADSSNTATVEQLAASTAGVVAVSNSYGTTEANWFADTNIYNDAQRFQSADGSVAIVFASGDAGYGVNCPACLNTVLAVGGTKLTKTTTGRLWSETAWTKAGSGCDRDSAGLVTGHAALYARPAWNVTQMPDSSACTRRMVADVSAVADPATGVAVYAACGFSGLLFGTSSWCVIGGTSVAAPLWAGLIGSHSQIASYPAECGGVSAQNRIGCFLYFKAATLANQIYSYNPANTQLWDVTSGSNGSCSSSILCTAKAGYDGPTGLGTPKSGALAP